MRRRKRKMQTKTIPLMKWLLPPEVGGRSSGRLTAVGDLLQWVLDHGDKRWSFGWELERSISIQRSKWGRERLMGYNKKRKREIITWEGHSVHWFNHKGNREDIELMSWVHRSICQLISFVAWLVVSYALKLISEERERERKIGRG